MGAGVGLPVKHRQPIPAVQRFRLHPQPLKAALHIGLHALQPGAGAGEVVSGNAESDVLCPVNAVVAPADLPFEHPGKFAPYAVNVIMRRGNVHLIAPGGLRSAVDKGELERDRAVKVIEKGAPAVEDSRLILR